MPKSTKKPFKQVPASSKVETRKQKVLKPSRAQPVGRKTGWEWRSPCGQFGVIEIATEESKPAFYMAVLISPNCVELSKVEHPCRRMSYSVFIGKYHFCGCESFRRSVPEEGTGQQTCKHIRALLEMREAGRL